MSRWCSRHLSSPHRTCTCRSGTRHDPHNRAGKHATSSHARASQARTGTTEWPRYTVPARCTCWDSCTSRKRGHSSRWRTRRCHRSTGRGRSTTASRGSCAASSRPPCIPARIRIRSRRTRRAHRRTSSCAGTSPRSSPRHRSRDRSSTCHCSTARVARSRSGTCVGCSRGRSSRHRSGTAG